LALIRNLKSVNKLKSIIKAVITVSLFLNSISCYGSNSFVDNEIVMGPDMVVTAERNGEILSISAEDRFNRTYTVGKISEQVRLEKRDKRWNGSFGIYSPSGNGDIHLVVEEGYQHFYSEEEALEWLHWQDNQFHYIYTSGGLVVGWYIERDSESEPISLSVQLWQFYIQGEKPINLKGAEDHLISVNGQKDKYSNPPEKSAFNPSAPKSIGTLNLSGKSVDLMKEKRMSIQDIKNCIRDGKVDKRNNYTFYYDLKNKFLWVMLDKHDRVVLLGD